MMNDPVFNKVEKDLKVTVLMSVYNGEPYLREAVESILNQTFTDFEFIIINDASTDSSREVIRSYKDPRIRLIDNEENIGLTKSLNKGLALARGEYVARQDADDISLPQRLERQVEYLNEHQEVVILGTRVQNIDERGRFLYPLGWMSVLDEKAVRWACMFESPFVHSSVMMRLQIIRDQYGGYHPDYVSSQDHELWSRVVYEQTCRNLDEQLVYFRSHTQSVSSGYRLNSVQKVAYTLQQAAKASLKQDPPEEWVGQWIILNNMNLYPSQPNIDQLVQIIDQMEARFILINKIMTDQALIRDHKHHLFARIAYHAIDVNRLGSLSLFWRIFREDIKIAGQIFFRYISVWIIGRNSMRKIKERMGR